MNTLSTITSGLMAEILSSILPAILGLLGLLVTMVFGTWGVLKVYAHLTGKSSADVSYKVGRIFGELVDEERYSEFKSKRSAYDRRARYEQRYRDEL